MELRDTLRDSITNAGAGFVAVSLTNVVIQAHAVFISQRMIYHDLQLKAVEQLYGKDSLEAYTLRQQLAGMKLLCDDLLVEKGKSPGE